MNWLDLAIAGVIAWMTFSAFRTGLIRVVASFASTILGAVLAGRFYGRLAENIEFMVENPEIRNLVAFVAIFAGLVILGQVIAAMLKTVTSLLFLGPLDHLGGAVVGLIQGVLVVELLLFAVTTFPATPGLARALEGSTLAPVFIERIPVFERLLPVEFRAALDAFRAASQFLPGGMPGMPPMDIPAGVVPGPTGR